MRFDETSAITELDGDALELVDDVGDVDDQADGYGAGSSEADEEEDEDDGSFERRGTPATVVASTSARLLEAESQRAQWSERDRAGGAANASLGDEGWGLGPTKPEIEELFPRSEQSTVPEGVSALEPVPPVASKPREPTLRGLPVASTQRQPTPSGLAAASGPRQPASLGPAAASSPRQPTVLGLAAAEPLAPLSPRPALHALPNLRLPGSSGKVGTARAPSERSVPAVAAANRAGTAAVAPPRPPRAWGYGPMGYVIVALAGLLGVAIGLVIRTRISPSTPPAALVESTETAPSAVGQSPPAPPDY